MGRHRLNEISKLRNFLKSERKILVEKGKKAYNKGNEFAGAEYLERAASLGSNEAVEILNEKYSRSK